MFEGDYNQRKKDKINSFFSAHRKDDGDMARMKVA